jgi:hypothetical protein
MMNVAAICRERRNHGDVEDPWAPIADEQDGIHGEEAGQHAERHR